MKALKFGMMLAVILASVAPAADYFPLQTGNQWSYTMSNGMQMTVAVTGAAPVRGVKCAIVETTMGWQSSREFMTYEADGLKTYKTQAQGQEMLHNPPVVRLKLPFQPGQRWTSTINQGGMSVMTTYQSVGQQRVQTQAGVFDCIIVRSTATLPGQAPMVSQSYYAAGVGLVYQTVQAGGQELIASLVASNVKPVTEPTPAEQPQPTQPPTQPTTTTPPPTWPTQPTMPTAPAETPKVVRCPKCNTAVSETAKFCPECGTKIVRPVAPTHCPKCNMKLPAGAKFCPACGQKLAMPAAATPTVTHPTRTSPPTTPALPEMPTKTMGGQATNLEMERYQSPDGTVQLYKPVDWITQQETFDNGAMAVSVMEPEENAAVIFMTFAVDESIDNSVKLMARCMTGLRDEYPDIKATSVGSSPDKERTIADLALTAEGKQAVGHGYFFYTQRVGTVYFLLAREDMWDGMHQTLTTIAANLAYAPEGVAAVVQQAQAVASQAPLAPGEAVSPAALLQRAKGQPGIQLSLLPAVLPDQSVSLEIPQGWNIEGQKLQFIATNDAQTRTHGMASVSHTVIPMAMNVPGAITAPYQPPAQALKLVLESGQTTRNVRVLSECPAEQALPDIAQMIGQMRAQGLQVDARVLYTEFENIPTGITQRGFFSVQCSTSPMSPVWQANIQGCWAPVNEFEQWLPLFMRMEKTIQVNQQWVARELGARAVRQQELNKGLMNSIAESNQAFDDYMGSLQRADRSRDYIGHMWSQTTLGQGTWVAEHEGAKVYQTDSWGIEGPEGRLDGDPFNTTNFTGVNPWDGGDLEMVDTYDEYEQYIANP